VIIITFLNKTIKYFLNNLYEKWRYIYLELNVNDFAFKFLKKDDSLVISLAAKKDIKEIKKDLYPQFDSNQEFFKQFIERIGEDRFSCFIAKRDRRIVHYFIVFENAIDSPLVKTPLRNSLYSDKDAYLANAFTVPSERGKWILPGVIAAVMDYLNKETEVKRVLVLVHKGTPGAVTFYKHLGFRKIEDATNLDLLLENLRFNLLKN